MNGAGEEDRVSVEREGGGRKREREGRFRDIPTRIMCTRSDRFYVSHRL
jgi:hypothetical protein